MCYNYIECLFPCVAFRVSNTNPDPLTKRACVSRNHGLGTAASGTQRPSSTFPHCGRWRPQCQERTKKAVFPVPSHIVGHPDGPPGPTGPRRSAPSPPTITKQEFPSGQPLNLDREPGERRPECRRLPRLRRIDAGGGAGIPSFLLRGLFSVAPATEGGSNKWFGMRSA
jgi:hypothetical protein